MTDHYISGAGNQDLPLDAASSALFATLAEHGESGSVDLDSPNLVETVITESVNNLASQIPLDTEQITASVTEVSKILARNNQTKYLLHR